MFKKLVLIAAFSATVPLFAGASKTSYPVVFAHGMAGFDNLLGYDYWGDDFGTFVGDPCDAFLEIACNRDLNKGQKAFATSVQPMHNSEVRGTQLADDIEGYMATVGASYVNLVGHSQGGMDSRKAATVLKQRKGRAVIKVMISVSSPHRGSPIAKHILDLGPTVDAVLAALFNVYGTVVYAPGNDSIGAVKQLMYNDFTSADGITTGAKQFNVKYNVDATTASHYASIVTAQNYIYVNPALWILAMGKKIDGDGYCVDDCDNDGAAGKGDGNVNNDDDDGLVPMNSQQMGYRLKVNSCFLCMDTLNQVSSTGYVSNLNAPSSIQMTSREGIVAQDHLDVVGLPPDTFDEMEFYAGMINYIAYYD